MARFPWLQIRKKTGTEPPLETPILLGNKSNGEFFWEATPPEKHAFVADWGEPLEE